MSTLNHSAKKSLLAYLLCSFGVVTFGISSWLGYKDIVQMNLNHQINVAWTGEMDVLDGQLNQSLTQLKQKENKFLEASRQELLAYLKPSQEKLDQEVAELNKQLKEDVASLETDQETKIDEMEENREYLIQSKIDKWESEQLQEVEEKLNNYSYQLNNSKEVAAEIVSDQIGTPNKCFIFISESICHPIHSRSRYEMEKEVEPIVRQEARQKLTELTAQKEEILKRIETQRPETEKRATKEFEEDIVKVKKQFQQRILKVQTKANDLIQKKQAEFDELKLEKQDELNQRDAQKKQEIELGKQQVITYISQQRQGLRESIELKVQDEFDYVLAYLSTGGGAIVGSSIAIFLAILAYEIVIDSKKNKFYLFAGSLILVGIFSGAITVRKVDIIPIAFQSENQIVAVGLPALVNSGSMAFYGMFSTGLLAMAVSRKLESAKN